jgi:hypothetical protein
VSAGLSKGGSSGTMACHAFVGVGAAVMGEA